MNLEQLQAMADEELDALTAPIMGMIYQNGKLWEVLDNGRPRWVRDWNPANYMNDAMELLNKAIEESKWTAATISIPADNVILFRHTAEELIIDEEDSLTRAITIASILAKESE